MATVAASKGRKTARPAQDGDSASEKIEAALASLQVIRSRRIRQIVNVVPVVILIATILLTFALWFTVRVVQLGFPSVGLTGILVILVVRELYARFPRTLSVWRRRLLRPKNQLSEGDFADQFMAFIQKSEQQLNNRYGLIFGLVLMLAMMLMFSPFAGLSPRQWIEHLQADWFSTLTSILIFLSYYTAAFIGGLILWRVVVIGRRISRLGAEFEFSLQVEHPDGCGGFRPVGDLCLTLAYILAPFLLLIGGWLVTIGILGQNAVTGYLYLSPAAMPVFVARLQVMAVLLAALSMLAFLQPLASIHEAMSLCRTRLQDDLDQLSEEIHETSTELRTRAEDLTAQEGLSIEQKIDFLQRVYNRNMKIPTWPINYDHVWRLLSIQVAPAIGIATSGLGLVSGLMGMLKH